MEPTPDRDEPRDAPRERGAPTSPIVSDFNARVYEEHEKRGGTWRSLPAAYLAAIRRSRWLGGGPKRD